MIPHLLRKNMRSGDPPVVGVVFNFPDGGSHASTSGCIDHDGLLLYERQIRTVDQPTIREMIQQYFHLSRSMEHISWGAEDDQLGPFHGSKDRGKCRSSAAFLLLSFDTGIASHANMGHVPWQLKLKKLIVRQKLPDEQPGNVVGT